MGGIDGQRLCLWLPPHSRTLLNCGHVALQAREDAGEACLLWRPAVYYKHEAFLTIRRWHQVNDNSWQPFLQNVLVCSLLFWLKTVLYCIIVSWHLYPKLHTVDGRITLYVCPLGFKPTTFAWLAQSPTWLVAHFPDAWCYTVCWVVYTDQFKLAVFKLIGKAALLTGCLQDLTPQTEMVQ